MNLLFMIDDKRRPQVWWEVFSVLMGIQPWTPKVTAICVLGVTGSMTVVTSGHLNGDL